MRDSRLVRADQLAERCQPWQAPEVAAPAAARTTADDPRRLREEARQAGFAEGRAAGLAAAREETAARTAALERVLDVLSRPFEELDHRFHDEILELVRAIARQLLRREMRLDPGHVVGIVREALTALPMSATDIVVRMHPDDAAIVRECLPAETDPRHWRIEADALMERGGCIVVTAQSQIDGRMETRLARTIAAMFEDERGEPADAPDAEPRH